MVAADVGAAVAGPAAVVAVVAAIGFTGSASGWAAWIRAAPVLPGPEDREVGSAALALVRITRAAA